jgi:hypothetical protein
VARFSPFGRRQDGPVAHEPDPWLDDPPPRTARGPEADPVGWDVGVRSIPATRAATPAMWAPRPVEPVEDTNAPVTDPFGFPPVPPVQGARDRAPAWAAWVPDRGPRASMTPPKRSSGPLEESPRLPDGRPSDGELTAAADPMSEDGASVRSPWAVDAGPGEADPSSPSVYAGPDISSTTPSGHPGEPTLDPAEAAALAGAFAADYLSWDEDDPARRGRALADHLPGPGTDHALLGWSGTGRQRAEIVLPGAVRPDGDGRLLVDVRVRVTPYRRVSRSEATPEPDPRDALGTPSAAPSVTARGWRGLAARWVRLGVTVVRDGDRLVVDAGEETFEEPDGEPRPPVQVPARSVRAAEDPTLDGDDVVSTGSRR